VTGRVALRALANQARNRAIGALGGRRHARVVLALAAVLALNGADTAAVSATASSIERAFDVGNTAIGLLVSLVSIVGALFTIPSGVLADRVRRVRLLAVSVALWAVASAVSGLATSYLWMVLARTALGGVTAVSGPVVASLTGDYFSPGERGRMYGLIIGGDLAGTGIGFMISGEISSVLTWRSAFLWPVLPTLALAWALRRLPEPPRGRTVEADGPENRPAAETASDAAKPQRELILRSNPERWPLREAVRYVLSIRTNVVIIVASGLGYFYFTGLRSFAIIFSTSHYGISKPVASLLVPVLGVVALAGVYAGGRISDRMLRRGYARARVIVPVACLLALPTVLAPGIAARVPAIAFFFLAVGSFLLGAPNAPMDAARLDIMHPLLWGRAEAVRTALRTGLEAAAPLLFGYTSQYVFGARAASGPGGGGQGGSGGGGSGGAIGEAQSTGLEYTFLVFLIPLLAAGLLALIALRTYPRDVATARASVQRLNESTGQLTSEDHPE
jgi:predicted MFS family arabinose efflux permease